MNFDFWRSRWETHQIGFHQAGATPALIDAIDRVAPDRSSRVLVPLCGKTKDMMFLAARGHAVTGVEWVEQALVEFFSENELAHEVTKPAEGITKLTADRIEGYACDFLKLDPKMTGKFAWAFDRASLVTFEDADQPEYIAHLASFLEPGGRILVIGFHYDPTEMSGPPCSVSGARIEQLFKDARRRERVAERDALDERFRAKGLTWLREEAWLIEL